MISQTWRRDYCLSERELLEMKRRRCVGDMDNLQKEIYEIDRQIEAMELREQSAA